MHAWLASVILLLLVCQGSTFSLLIDPLKNAARNARLNRKSLHMHMSSVRHMFKDHEVGPFEKVVLEESGRKYRRQHTPGDTVLGRTASWVLNKVVRSHVHRITGLMISVKAKSNTDVVKGQFESIHMKFDELRSEQLDVSGGGSISVSGLHVDLNTLLFQSRQYVRKPYSVHLDLRVSQRDLTKSLFVKNLLQTLCNDALMRTFGASDSINTTITSIDTVDDRIFVRGEVSGLLDSQITSWNLRGTPPEDNTLGTNMGANTASSTPFEMSTALSMRVESGRVLLLQDLSVVMNPDNILRTSLPVPAIEVDLGDGCHIESLRIANNELRFTGNVTITPNTPQVLAVPVTEPTWADTLHPLSLLWAGWTTTLYRYDLSSIISSNINLNGGIVSGWLEKKFRFRW